jgi:starvation-inducible DNA-binding protein
MKKYTGIEDKHSEEIVSNLNQLLADYHLHYQNLRGFHWNISGPGFFELHRHFEELYTEALTTIDELAERILTLGGRPLHAMSSYVKEANIQEAIDLSTPEDTINSTLNALAVLLKQERDLVNIAGDAGDEGTVDLLTPLIAAQEKEAWMLRSYLK